MRAVIMAGGKGTRIRGVTGPAVPKPMVEIAGKPVLQHQVECLERQGIAEIVMVVGYLGDVIQRHFGDGSGFGVHIDYLVEDEPLGSAGSLFFLKGEVDEDFLLLFGDVLFDVDFDRFVEYHRAKSSKLTLLVHPNSHPYDSDLVVMSESGMVAGIIGKDAERPFAYGNYVNAGLYVVSPAALECLTDAGRADFEGDVVSRAILSGECFAYRSSEYVKDMGTPERYAAVSRDVASGLPASKNLKRKQKCVFLDRDGTINVHKGFISKAADIELLPGAGEAVRKINDAGYLAVVLTNQPVVARGECSLDELEEINSRVEVLLGRSGAYVDDLLYCPHHPDKGFAGEVESLKVRCRCRKPSTEMLDEAARRWNVDLSRSWMVGDSTSDIQLAANAGIRSILVRTGEAGVDGKYTAAPDYVCEDLNDAVEVILECDER